MRTTLLLIIAVLIPVPSMGEMYWSDTDVGGGGWLQSGTFHPTNPDIIIIGTDVTGGASGVRGVTVPAVLFLEANRGAGSLDGLGMLFFDPAVRRIFGGGIPGASSLLADDDGIDRLIDRLEELDADFGLDA